MLPPLFFLDGDWMLVNISLPENTGGVSLVNRDPRKQEYKPDAYVGVVEKIGPDCGVVAVGDKIVFERWEYSQHNADDERVVIREVDVLVGGDEKPLPGIVAVQVLENVSALAPQTVRPTESPTTLCKVVNSGVEEIKENEFYVLQRGDKQYRVGEHTLVFRMDGGLEYSEILLSRVEELHVGVC